LALLIRTPGKFSLILFALIVIVIASRKSFAKGTVATALGVMIATVGIDVMEPVARFTFGFEIFRRRHQHDAADHRHLCHQRDPDHAEHNRSGAVVVEGNQDPPSRFPADPSPTFARSAF
jgi:hypothetical protein